MKHEDKNNLTILLNNMFGRAEVKKCKENVMAQGLTGVLRKIMASLVDCWEEVNHKMDMEELLERFKLISKSLTQNADGL